MAGKKRKAAKLDPSEASALLKTKKPGGSKVVRTENG
jgi:hypothetical protein